MPNGVVDATALAEVTVFIIEGRTAGVLAALVITAAMVVLGDVLEQVKVVEAPSVANATPTFPWTAVPGD